MREILKLDYTIQSPEERNNLVKQILDEYPEEPNEKYLEVLADYLILCMEKQEKREKKILTENRMATVNKRETSFEGLVAQLENGENGIYGLINESKTMIFQPHVSITQKDLQEIPMLKQLRDVINLWEKKLKTISGRDAYVMKRALIEMRKDQYIIKNAYRRPIVFNKLTRSKFYIPLDEEYKIEENGDLIINGVSLCDPVTCSAILCNYSKLKEDTWDQFEGDLWYLLLDFEKVCDKALEKYPMYMRLIECKIDGMQNAEIQKILKEEFNITHSLEYISSLWRRKIPGLIAAQAQDDLLNWHYLTKEKGNYKKCSRCGQIKLARNKYFSINKTSRDGFYSICKECRNTKNLLFT